MGLFSRKNPDANRPMTPDELRERSRFDGIRYMDLQVVDNLVKLGADPRQPRHVLFYMYFADEASALPAAEVLRGRGFEVSLREPWEKVPRWSLLAESRDRALIPDFLRETADICDVLAANHGGEYDGWEAGLTTAEAAARTKKKG